MSHDGLVKADGEFLQGHFEEAKELYSHALDQLEAAYPEQHRELCACLQKLGDTNYVLDRFAEAEQVFARLLNVLEQNDGPVQDIVTTLLKLAKNKEKLERLEEAVIMYERATELGETSLASGHYLVSSIHTSYAALLTRTKCNPERLAEIEEKIAPLSKSGAGDDDETTADADQEEESEGEGADGERKVNAAEMDAMRSKLRKASTRRQVDDAGTGKKRPKLKLQVPDATASDAKAKSPAEGDGEAAAPGERKWLRKDKFKTAKSDDRVKGRSKLRKAMLKGGPGAPPPPTPEDIANAEAQQAAEEAAAQEKPAPHVLSETARKFIGGSKKRVQGPYVPAEQDPAIQKTTGKKRGINLGQTAAAGPVELDRQGRLTRSSDKLQLKPSKASEPDGDATESGATPDVARTDFTVKPEGAEPTEDLVQLSPKLKETDTRAEASRDQIAPVTGIKKFVFPAVGLAILGAWGVFMMFTLHSSESGRTSWWSRYVGKTYASADGLKSLTFANGKADLAASSKTVSVPVRYWEGGPKDEFDLVTGALDSAAWVSEVPEGLADEYGIVLYAGDAPENRVVVNMRGIVRAAQSFYIDNKRYPQYSSELAPNDSYKNPVTNAMEAPQMCSSVGKDIIKNDEKTEFESKLETGASFTDEAKPAAGSIRTFGVLAHPDFNAESNSYKWSSQSFFVHGFDRLGALIKGGEKNKILLFCLKNGQDVTPAMVPNWFEKPDSSGTLCLSRVSKPSKYSVFFKYFASVFALLLVFGAYRLFQYAKNKEQV